MQPHAPAFGRNRDQDESTLQLQVIVHMLSVLCANSGYLGVVFACTMNQLFRRCGSITGAGRAGTATRLRARRRFSGKGRAVELKRRAEGGSRGAARAHLQPERRRPAHQRQPRRRHRPARDRRQRPRPHRRPLRRDHDHRRSRAAAGLRHLRPHRRRAAADGGLAPRDALLRAPPRPAGSAQAAGPAGLPALARLCRRPGPVEDPAGDADASPGRARRRLLPRGEGGRTGVHGRRRRDPDAVRLAGRERHRQRPRTPRRAAGAGRPRGPGGDLAGRRRGVRRRDRQAGVVEPGGEAARRQAERPRIAPRRSCSRR